MLVEMLNLDKNALMHMQSFVRRVEASTLYKITCIGKMSKYAVIFAHKGESNKLHCPEL